MPPVRRSERLSGPDATQPRPTTPRVETKNKAGEKKKTKPKVNADEKQAQKIKKTAVDETISKPAIASQTIPKLPSAAWTRPQNNKDQNKLATAILYSPAKCRGIFGSEKKIRGTVKRPISEAGRGAARPNEITQLSSKQWRQMNDLCSNFADVLGRKISPSARKILFRVLLNHDKNNFRNGIGLPSPVQRVLEHLSDEAVPFYLEGSSWNLFYYDKRTEAAYPPANPQELEELKVQLSLAYVSRDRPEKLLALTRELQAHLEQVFSLSSPAAYRAIFVEEQKEQRKQGTNSNLLHPVCTFIGLCVMFWSGHFDIDSASWFSSMDTNYNFRIAARGQESTNGERPYSSQDLVATLRATNKSKRWKLSEWAQVRKREDEDVDAGDLVHLDEPSWERYVRDAQSELRRNLKKPDLVISQCNGLWLSEASQALARAKLKTTAISKTQWTHAELDIIAYMFIDDPDAITRTGGFRRQVDQVTLLLPGRSFQAIIKKIRLQGNEIARRAKEMQAANPEDAKARYQQARQSHQTHVEKVRPPVLEGDGEINLHQLVNQNVRRKATIGGDKGATTATKQQARLPDNASFDEMEIENWTESDDEGWTSDEDKQKQSARVNDPARYVFAIVPWVRRR